MKKKIMLSVLLLSFVMTAVAQEIVKVVPVHKESKVMIRHKDRIFIAGGGELIVVNLNTKSVEATILLNKNPNSYVDSICFGEDFGVVIPLGFIGASTHGSSRVYLVDPLTLEVKEFYPGFYASGCAVSNDGRLLYLSGVKSDIDIINIKILVAFNKNLEKVKTFQVPHGIRTIISSPDGTIYMGLSYGWAVGWLAVLRNDQLKTILLPPAVVKYDPNITNSLTPGTFIPDNLFFHPDGKKLYISGAVRNWRFAGLLVVDTVTDEVIGFEYLFTVRDLKFISNTLAYKASGDIYIWDLATNSHSLLISVGERVISYALEVIPGDDFQDTLVVLKNNGELVFFKQKRPEEIKLPVVTNAASFYVRPLVPGQLATIWGENLSSETEGAQSVPLPTELAKTRVLVDGILAPLLFVSPGQINFQVPYELPTSIKTKLEVLNEGRVVAEINTESDYFDAGIFSAEIEGAWRPIVVNVSRNPWELVTPSNPALPGEWLTLYLTGLGPVTPPVETGKAAPFNPLAIAANPIEVKFNGQPCETNFVGLTPGLVGIYQINLKVPEGTLSGMHIVEIGRKYYPSLYIIIHTKES